MSTTEVAKLNVGGRIFTTTISTLTKVPSSMLASMFSGNYADSRDSEGCYFIDNDGLTFHVVLNFLRHGKMIISDFEFCRLKEQLMHDAEYYCLEELKQAISARNEEQKALQMRNEEGITRISDKLGLMAGPQNSVINLLLKSARGSSTC